LFLGNCDGFKCDNGRCISKKSQFTIGKRLNIVDLLYLGCNPVVVVVSAKFFAATDITTRAGTTRRLAVMIPKPMIIA